MSERLLKSVLLLIIFCISVLRPAAADDRPADLRRQVNQHEQEVARLKRDVDSKLDADLKKLQLTLKELQDKYTKEALLDEAVAVRDCLKRLDEFADADLKLNALQADMPSLPVDAVGAIQRFAGPAKDLISTRDDAVQTAVQAHREKLSVLLEKYTKAGDLDAALAVREAIRSVGDPSPAGNKKAIGVADLKVSFPKDFAAAEQKYNQLAGKLQQQRQEATARLMKSLVSTFRSEQNRATRAGKLDDAVALRDLITSFEKETNNLKQQDLLRIHRDKLSETARQAANEFLERYHETAAASQAELDVLNKAFAPSTEQPIKEALLAGDVEKSRQLLERYYSLLRIPMIHHYRHQKPPFSKEALALVEPFEKETHDRRRACEASELPERRRLIEAFRNLLPGAPAEESQALSKAIDFFTADYTIGPQRGRLFVPDEHLPKGAVELFEDYCRETVQLEQQLAVNQSTAARKLREDLKAVVRQHVADGQLTEAWAILARGPDFDQLPLETPVKFAHVPHWADHLSDAVVLDVKKNAVLIRQPPHNNNGVWVPRRRIRFAPDDAIAVVKPGDPIPGPGMQVTDATPLKRGQTVFYQWGSSLYEATVFDLTGTGVVIKYRDRWR
ncbi:MAG: hypothetical protein KDA89_16250, partial [Planctomycetaceae bacterium]|nr:hypothetical protein [Planctomycetaceae bacterium]